MSGLDEKGLVAAVKAHNDAYWTTGNDSEGAHKRMEAAIRAYLSAVGQKDGTVEAGPPFHFDRYVNGVLMAEGVTIERQTTFEAAAREAARIASRGPNGEAPVLVLTPSPVDTDGVKGLVERAGPVAWRWKSIAADPRWPEGWGYGMHLPDMEDGIEYHPLYSATTLAALKAELDEARRQLKAKNQTFCARLDTGVCDLPERLAAAESRLAAVVETRAEIVEQCAKVAERDGSSHAAPYPHSDQWRHDTTQQVKAADRIAASIRNLKDKP